MTSDRPRLPRSGSIGSRWRATLVGLGLFALALVPRIADLSRFVTWDELFWTRASLRFYRELDGQDWRGTYIIGQPGVVTMWLASSAFAIRALGGRAATNDAQLEAGKSKYRDDDVATLRLLVGHWRGLAAAIAVFTALAVVVTWQWLRRPWGEGAAASAAVLLALEPFYIAHSRVVALDAVLASLCLLAVVALLRFAETAERRWLLAGAALAGLAAVQKVPALCILAYGAGVVAWVAVRRGGWRVGVTSFLLWVSLAALVTWLVWPALWVAPLATAQRILSTITTYQAEAYDAMFFAGASGRPPGPWFYPAVLWWRLSPLVWLGLACLLWRGLRGDRRLPWRSVAILAGASAVYLLMLTAPATKFDRYALPAMLPIILLAGLGWWHQLAPMGRMARWLPAWPTAAVALLALLQLRSVDGSYFLAWYNPLAGGVHAARQVLPLGWGEGTDQVIRYLSALDRPEDVIVASNDLVGLAPSRAQLVRTGAATCREADIVMVYAFDRQLGTSAATSYGLETPVFVAMVGGEPYAWLYRGGLPCGS